MRRLALSILALFTATPAAAQGDLPWVQPGAQLPLYLVQCVPTPNAAACAGDGLALVSDPALHTGVRLRVLGGPFTQRWQVENMRASLVRQGFPSHALWIAFVNDAGQPAGGFWMGKRPTCLDIFGRSLSGDVNADFAATVGGRPPTFPVTEDAFGAYMAFMQEEVPRCSERQGRDNLFSGRSPGDDFGRPPTPTSPPCDRPPCGEPLRMRPD
jgi:hypothetical protein